MKLRSVVPWHVVVLGCVWCFAIAACAARADEYLSGIKWPEPKVVSPGEGTKPPADAIVLFDGSGFEKWEGAQNWRIEEGVAIVHKGSIKTKQSFGDCQLHLEWMIPHLPKNQVGQNRGNSGVFLQDRYEVQIMDSYINTTYYDGQAGAIYKQVPPLVNVCKPNGEWQTFDVIFRAPRLNKEGEVTTPATITVLHNGVLVQDHFAIKGLTSWDTPPYYEKPGVTKGPVRLQDHDSPVHYRNIWIRELTGE